MYAHISGSRHAAGLCLVVALAACGGPVDQDEIDEYAAAATTLTSTDGQLKVQQTPTRNRDGVVVKIPTWLAKAPRSVETTVGGEAFDGIKKGRSGRYEWQLDLGALAQAMRGDQPHLLADYDGENRYVLSFDVLPEVKLVRGPASLLDVRLDRTGKGALRLLFEAKGALTAVTSTQGTVAPVEGLPDHFEWVLPLADAARIVAAARVVKVEATVNGRKSAVQVSFNVSARYPVTARVPADFHAGVMTLAEHPDRKIDPATTDPAALRLLRAVAAALAADPALNLNVARLAWDPEAGLVAYQGHGAIGEGGDHTESWWLTSRELSRRLTRAAGGLEVVVRSEGGR